MYTSETALKKFSPAMLGNLIGNSLIKNKKAKFQDKLLHVIRFDSLNKPIRVSLKMNVDFILAYCIYFLLESDKVYIAYVVFNIKSGYIERLELNF